jgi:hypothetical protein
LRQQIAAHLCGLPDEVLRLMPTFMPTSSLAVLARSNQRLATIYRDELTRRFDGLFTIWDPFTLHSESSNLHWSQAQANLMIGKSSQSVLKSLFGEENLFYSGQSGYHLIEATEESDEHGRQLLLYRQPGGDHYAVQGLALPVLYLFKSWLRIQLEKKNI